MTRWALLRCLLSSFVLMLLGVFSKDCLLDYYNFLASTLAFMVEFNCCSRFLRLNLNYQYMVFSLSYEIFRDLYLFANYRIFLSFIPLPYNLLSRSISDVSYLVHFIYYCACCKIDFALFGLGGKGVVPILWVYMDESESAS